MDMSIVIKMFISMDMSIIITMLIGIVGRCL